MLLQFAQIFFVYFPRIHLDDEATLEALSERLSAVGNPFLHNIDGQRKSGTAQAKMSVEEMTSEAREILPRLLNGERAGLSEILLLAQLLYDGLVIAGGLRGTALLDGKEVNHEKGVGFLFISDSFLACCMVCEAAAMHSCACQNFVDRARGLLSLLFLFRIFHFKVSLLLDG